MRIGGLCETRCIVRIVRIVRIVLYNDNSYCYGIKGLRLILLASWLNQLTPA